MIDYAQGRIQILPGAGVTPKNCGRLVRESGCTQVHMAAHRPRFDASVNNNRDIFYGGCLYPPEDRYQVTDAAVISSAAEKLAQL